MCVCERGDVCVSDMMMHLSVKKILQYIFLGMDHAKYGINRQTIVPYLRTGFQQVRYGTNVGGFHLRALGSVFVAVDSCICM